MSDRQFDIPLTTQYHYSIPTNVKGRITADDFVYFSISDINPYDYDVAIQSFSGDFRIVGPLKKDLQDMGTLEETLDNISSYKTPLNILAMKF